MGEIDRWTQAPSKEHGARSLRKNTLKHYTLCGDGRDGQLVMLSERAFTSRIWKFLFWLSREWG